MTLKEKFDNLDTEDIFYHNLDGCEKIADYFAIGFAEWLINKRQLINYQDKKEYSELLEVYKKEKGL